MTGYKIGMAEEAVIADLTANLVECQAREAKLREYIFMISTSPAYPEAIYKWCKEALALPQDDTSPRVEEE